MNKLKLLLIVLPTTAAISTAPVFAKADLAHSGSSGNSSDSSSQDSSSPDSSGSSTPTLTEQQKQALEQAREALKQKVEDKSTTKSDSKDATETEVEDSNKTRAGAILTEMMKNKKSHSEAQRKLNCKTGQAALVKKLTNLQTNAATAQAKIDSILLKALAYQASSGLTPTGFTDLVNAANTAKTNAAASVTVLQGLSVNIDCTSPTVATDIATFKAAAEQTKTNLQTYKTTVKAILTALKTSTEGGTQ